MPNTDDLDKKISELRAIYTSPDSKQTIDDIERNLRNKITAAKLSENDLVQEIIEWHQKQILQIDFLLAYDPKLNEPTTEAAINRQGLIRERSVHKFILDRFGSKASDALAQLEASIDALLSRGRNG
jgi:hypothetical protein